MRRRPMLRFRPVAGLAGAALLLAAPAASATVFPATGGRGDRAEEYRCPDGYALVGFRGRTGTWIDQIGLICAELRMPEFRLGVPRAMQPRGGGGGSPAEQYCTGGAAIRTLQPRLLYHKGWNYVGSLTFWCARPADGSHAGAARFAGDGRYDAQSNPDAHSELEVPLQECPGNEYATGLNIRYGRHVNAVGLICGAFDYRPPAEKPAEPAPAPINRHVQQARPVGATLPAVKPLPAEIAAVTTTGVFDTDFGSMTIGPMVGYYSHSGGRLWITQRNGNTLRGQWAQMSAGRTCADGKHWGTFVFTFTAAGFTGTYGYCGEPATAGSWTGRRR